MSSNRFQFKRQVPFFGLTDEHRSLAEHVYQSTHVNPQVRVRAQAFLLLDQGASLESLVSATSLTKTAIRAMIAQYGHQGLLSALLNPVMPRHARPRTSLAAAA